MEKLITGGLGFTASEIVQQSNVNDVAGAITQILIAIITIIGLFNKKKKYNKMKRKILIELLKFLTIELSKQLVKIDKKRNI